MAVFEYEVVTQAGSIEIGNIEAETQETASQKLRNNGYLIVEIKEKRTKQFSQLFSLKKKVKLGDLSLFSRQLAVMINAGIPLTRAIYTLSEQSTNKILKSALEDIAVNIESGMRFTDVLNNHKNIFSDLYIGMVNAGEVGGTLDETLSRLSDQLQKEKTLKENLKSATIYPGMVIIFAVIVMVAMLVFLVPVFIDMFPSDMALPLPTVMVIFLSESLRGYWFLWVGALFITYFLCRFIIQSNLGQSIWDRIKFKIPILGQLIQKAVLARFSRTLSTLLAVGIPVMQALEAAGPSSGSLLLAKAVDAAREKIEEGKSIAGPLEQSGLFPPMVIQMIAIGEETGALTTLLTRIAEFYEDEVATLTKSLSSMLEPVMLILVGIMVGGMVVALYLPIFTAVTQF